MAVGSVTVAAVVTVGSSTIASNATIGSSMVASTATARPLAVIPTPLAVIVATRAPAPPSLVCILRHVPGPLSVPFSLFPCGAVARRTTCTMAPFGAMLAFEPLLLSMRFSLLSGISACANPFGISVTSFIVAASRLIRAPGPISLMASAVSVPCSSLVALAMQGRPAHISRLAGPALARPVAAVLVPNLGNRLTEIHFDSPVVDEDVVHLEERLLALFW
mmetsp:Transcript_17582/g.50330  ORF Transcript_17582/g.50330 Transcript_17582/m.50330 type:complete len:220 (+) Transcript_17582:178-837(+)